MNATETWRYMLQDITHGTDVAPMSAGADFKGRTSRELLAYTSVWDMARPIIACPARKLGYRFMTAEAAWTLSGDNRLATIKPYSKAIERFTDDGIHMAGAYGPPFVDQVSYVVQALATDVNSRQAVCTIWRPRPGKSNDTPCTVALQWMIRGGALHCIVTMRSSDAWTGVPYDIFNFSMMSAYVSLALHAFQMRELKLGRASALILPLPLGKLFLTAGSQHLYKQDWAEAQTCMEQGEESFEQTPLNVNDLSNPQSLVDYLWSAAQIGVQVPGAWLYEACPYKAPKVPA